MRAVLRLGVVALLVVAAACGGSGERGGEGAGPDPGDTLTEMPPDGGLAPQVAHEGDAIRGSGRALDGSFAADEGVSGAPVRYVFTVRGGFARVRDGRARESGTYVIDEHGRLVLFVERRGETSLSAAEREIARIELADDGFTLAGEWGPVMRFRRVERAPSDDVPATE